MNYKICFMGADHRCGTSMIAQCIAESIASTRRDLEIVLIHTEAKKGDEYTPMINESMDKLRPYLCQKLVDVDELARSSKYHKNLSIVGGAGDYQSSTKYNQEDVSYFLDHCLDKYDIVICDAGSEIEHGLCMGSILSSDDLYIVCTQRESAFRRLETYKALLDKVRGGYDYCIFNMFRRDSAYDLQYCKERLKLQDNQAFIVANSPFGDIAEIQSKSLMNYKSKAFSRDIEKITSRIINEFDYRK